jgi:hypothetical protein
MKDLRRWARPLLWLHLFVCMVWLYLFRTSNEPPGWTGHVMIWSILAIQFTWGFTVGLIAGPGRKQRGLLWWSLLTVFMPLWFFSHVVTMVSLFFGPLVGLVYLAIFVMILASETYCGLLLGAQAHARGRGE